MIPSVTEGESMKNINEEKKRLAVHVGYASRAAVSTESMKMEAAEELLPQECGDTAVSCRLLDGSQAVILSDGMGHGTEAAAGSRAAAGLLRRLLKQGMPTARAIKEVNRYLLDRSLRREGGESFANVDLVIIDRTSGRAKFYKMGAAPSYLIRGRRIRKMAQPALPVGILPGIRLTHVSTRLSPGDIIVMMSDGISDSGWRKDGTAAADDWVTSFLDDTMRRTAAAGTVPARMGPRELAAALLAEAARRYGTSETDDATAAVIVIGESRRKNRNEE